MKIVSAAGAVGTDGTDNVASFASLAAFVKRGVFRALHAVALDQRPGFVGDRERDAVVAIEGELDRTFGAGAIAARIRHRRAPRGVIPRYAPFTGVGAVDDRAPWLQIFHPAHPQQQA